MILIAEENSINLVYFMINVTLKKNLLVLKKYLFE